MEFPEGWGGGPLFEMILENPEGMGDHRKNSFRVRYRLYGYFQELHNRSLCVQLTNRAHLFHSSSQRERVISVFKRQLAVPLLGTEELFINDTFALMCFSLRSTPNNFMCSCFEKGCP